jgi:arylsulfatase A-like enzyme
LFVITDQQRADHVGYAGNDVIRTPHLDALAAQSTVFERAYVANPICMPNRSSILTGRMPSAHGCIFNDRALDWGANTFVRQLREAGYRTALLGKSHLQLGVDKHLIPGSDLQPAIRDGHPGSAYAFEFTDRYLSDDFEDPDDFYGFDRVEFSIDHGAKISGHHLRWALKKGARQDEIVVPMSAEAPALHRSRHWWQIYKPTYAPELHSTEFVTDRTIDFLEEACHEESPWMAWCSFPDPHHPMTPPGEWFERHRPDGMLTPPTLDDPLTQAPRFIRNTRKRRTPPVWVLPFGVHDPELAQEAMAATYGMLEFIDDAVGRIVAALDRLRARENTIIVFTSDHGDMLGDHGLMLKGSLHYSGVVRVPLLIALPGRDGARTEALACSVDLAQTILELCGLRNFDGMQGQSLVPVLEDPKARVRQSVLIEDDLAPHVAGLLRLPNKLRTLVTEHARYTRDSNGDEQLFDLGEDPDEIRELREDRPVLRGEMLEALSDALIEASDVGRGVPLHVAPGND